MSRFVKSLAKFLLWAAGCSFFAWLLWNFAFNDLYSRYEGATGVALVILGSASGWGLYLLLGYGFKKVLEVLLQPLFKRLAIHYKSENWILAGWPRLWVALSLTWTTLVCWQYFDPPSDGIVPSTVFIVCVVMLRWIPKWGAYKDFDSGRRVFLFVFLLACGIVVMGATTQFGGSNPQDDQQIVFLALAPIVALLLLEVVGKWVYRGYKKHGM